MFTTIWITYIIGLVVFSCWLFIDMKTRDSLDKFNIEDVYMVLLVSTIWPFVVGWCIIWGIVFLGIHLLKILGDKLKSRS